MDTKSGTRRPKSGKDGREVRKAVKMDTKSGTRRPKSGKDGREVRKAVKMDTKSGTRRPKSGGYLIVGHLPRQSIRKGSETSSQGSVNSCIARASLFACGQCAPVKDDKEDNALGDYAGNMW
ncbi:hypothetical protein CDL15_Pgr010682 [Punica granatum]|uniref:Uncharacterized protein n=1 Tax=Punica granatum TaxID=22663 RepID=A0A218XNF6_PUNGR|nr:hypothetical protein CDL15_Pgr010682 [Punica granatum]